MGVGVEVVGVMVGVTVTGVGVVTGVVGVTVGVTVMGLVGVGVTGSMVVGVIVGVTVTGLVGVGVTGSVVGVEVGGVVVGVAVIGLVVGVGEPGFPSVGLGWTILPTNTASVAEHGLKLASVGSLAVKLKIYCPATSVKV